jgi:hypothetical protein
MVLNTAWILWIGHKLQVFGKFFGQGRKKNYTFRTLYTKKIPIAFRVCSLADVIKKTHISPVKDTDWFNIERKLK